MHSSSVQAANSRFHSIKSCQESNALHLPVLKCSFASKAVDPVNQGFLCCAAEYLSDAVGYDLYDCAIGSAVTNSSISYHGVGDFYPSSLLSNKRGAINVTLPTFSDQIAM